MVGKVFLFLFFVVVACMDVCLCVCVCIVNGMNSSGNQNESFILHFCEKLTMVLIECLIG